jgi:hypothetical protein
MPVAQRQRSRQGRGRHGNQVGGARAGAGRPKAWDVRIGVRLPAALVEAASARALELGVPRAEVWRRAVAGLLQLPVARDGARVPETLYLTAVQAGRLGAEAQIRGLDLSSTVERLCSCSEQL